MSNIDRIRKASRVFTPDFPRKVSAANTIQRKVHNRDSLVRSLDRAEANEMPGYYSVYSFPHGHPNDGKLPKIDCIFIDLDVPGERYDPEDGRDSLAAWKREISGLLTRVRMIAKAILSDSKAEHFRAVLSGHKGLHLYLDFPPVHPDNGSFNQFKRGLSKYGKRVMQWLDSAAGGVDIEKWVDVDASDLARLARHPNTKHHGVAYSDSDRWAVPVTIEELSDMQVDDYLALTNAPRWRQDIERNPSEQAGRIAKQYVRTARSSDVSHNRSTSYDAGRVKRYRQQSTDEIELEDVLFLSANLPCIEAFRNRADAYEHGEASRVMELNAMGKMIEMETPIDVMHEFFAAIPRYDEEWTEHLITDIIGRDYGTFNCEKIIDRAPQFCLGDDCGVYQRNDDLQLPSDKQ